MVKKNWGWKLNHMDVNADFKAYVNLIVHFVGTNLRRVTCDNSLKTRTAPLSAKETFHGSHVWNVNKKKLLWEKITSVKLSSITARHMHALFQLSVVRAFYIFAIPGRVCSVGHQSADQQFMAVLSSNVERGIAILIHTVNLPTWCKVKEGSHQQKTWTHFLRAQSKKSPGYRFGWGSESVWSVHEWLPCAGGSSLLYSEERNKHITKRKTPHVQRNMATLLKV